jgi:hypothetical protein
MGTGLRNYSTTATGGSGGGFYRLPHAIGAITVFIKMLVKIFSKLIPSIMKLLKLFGNPMSFLTDIIIEKLGESFSIFSPEAKKKFEQVQKIVKDKSKYSKPSAPATPNAPGAPGVPSPPPPVVENRAISCLSLSQFVELQPLNC